MSRTIALISGTSSSELFGGLQKTAQNEQTPFYPRSPYAADKLYAFWIIINYREAYDMFAVDRRPGSCGRHS